MPCLVRNRRGEWTRLLISELEATAFAAATLNALGRNAKGLHDAVLYVRDDEDAEELLGRLNRVGEEDGEA